MGCKGGKVDGLSLYLAAVLYNGRERYVMQAPACSESRWFARPALALLRSVAGWPPLLLLLLLLLPPLALTESRGGKIDGCLSCYQMHRCHMTACV